MGVITFSTTRTTTAFEIGLNLSQNRSDLVLGFFLDFVLFLLTVD